MNKHQIGIIGYGDFTKLLVEYLSPYADIIINSRSKSSGEAEFGARFAELSNILSRPIIIPSIPAQYFENFFTVNKQLINPDALVIDVSSVKQQPLKILEELLPSTCQIFGTHPMFGPASVAKNNGIAGLRCVVCPVRIDSARSSKIIEFLGSELNLEVIERTPEQHDQEMAYVQGLSHYIGRLMDIMQIPDSKLSTLAYDDLLDMKKIQGGDSWDLFKSIMEENPFAYEVNENFKKAIELLDQKLAE